MSIKILGIPASKGEAAGRVEIFNEEEPYRKFNEPTILVAEYLPPNIVTLDDHVVGILVEESSILCHAACIARELHIPCIVGIESAENIFHAGEMVRMIGEAGEVIRV
jgi:pyruvate,water dikinase